MGEEFGIIFSYPKEATILKIYKLAWEKPYGFVVVDLTSNKDNGKYRIGLDTFSFIHSFTINQST